jgi:thioredoxin reductase (NADPH)
VRLTLLSRAYCHLCDEMLAVVAPVAAARGVALTVVDVDADPALEARFGERVPVLFAGDPATGTEIAHLACDAAAVERALA